MTSLSMGELNAVDYCLADNSAVAAVVLAVVVAADNSAVAVAVALAVAGPVVALAADYLL